MVVMGARIGLIAAVLANGVSESTRQMDEAPTAVLVHDYAGGLVKVPLPHRDGLGFNIEDSSMHRLLQHFHSPDPQKELADESDARSVTGSERPPTRRLQDTCEAGDAFTLSSTIYVEAEGCYTASEEISDIYEVVGTNRVYWMSATLFLTTGGSIYADIECFAEYVTESHPTDAGSWTCIFESRLIGVTGDSFSLACGCGALNGTLSPSTTPGTTEESLCGVTDSFSITSEQLPALEGCYSDTGNMNSTVFSQTGELTVGEVAVYIGYVDFEEMDSRWFVGTYGTNTTGGDVTATCISSEDPNEAHPVDTSWVCDFTGIGAYTLADEDKFRVDCNCSVTWTPSPVPTTSVAIPIQSGDENSSPTPAPTEESLCGVTDSFSITSEQLLALEGCYSDTENMNSTVFSQTGELTVGEVAVYIGYVDFEETDSRWFVGTYGTNTTGGDVTATCISSEDPNEAHPADTSWVCDFTGTGAYTVAEEDNFRVDCECNDTWAPSPVIIAPIDTLKNPTASPSIPIDPFDTRTDPSATNRAFEGVPVTALSATLTGIALVLLAAL